jgi:hypothetical protein
MPIYQPTSHLFADRLVNEAKARQGTSKPPVDATSLPQNRGETCRSCASAQHELPAPQAWATKAIPINPIISIETTSKPPHFYEPHARQRIELSSLRVKLHDSLDWSNGVLGQGWIMDGGQIPGVEYTRERLSALQG